jgi:hypothetical protein
MKKKLWFRAKTYGLGWTPCSWEGWTVVALYLLSVYAYVRGTVDTALDGSGHGTPLYYHAFIALATITLILICYTKGEKPGWRWGGRKASDEDSSN